MYVSAPACVYSCVCLAVCVCAVRARCVSEPEIMTMMTVAGPTGARGAEW